MLIKATIENEKAGHRWEKVLAALYLRKDLQNTYTFLQVNSKKINKTLVWSDAFRVFRTPIALTRGQSIQGSF